MGLFPSVVDMCSTVAHNWMSGVDAMTQLWFPYKSGIMSGCCNKDVHSYRNGLSDLLFLRSTMQCCSLGMVLRQARSIGYWMVIMRH